MTEARIAILMGSASDLPAFEQAQSLLAEFQVPYMLKVASAHRTPKQVVEFVETLPNSVEVVIAGAGGAAHLAGVVAAHTIKPVIGVPMPSVLNGLDSLLSTAQMPAGIPVATMAIGKAGASNAVLYALEILALHDETVAKHVREYRKSLARKVEKSNESLQT